MGIPYIPRSEWSGTHDMQRRSKKLYIKTYGCQMNVYDATRMRDALATVGYDRTTDINDADLIILNTCHIREKASEKVYSELGRLRQIKNERNSDGKKTLIVVAGCVAQAEGKEILSRAPIVDLVVGPQSYHRLPDLIFSVRQEDRQLVDTEFPVEDKFRFLPLTKTEKLPSAFLTVQEGCDKFCTFCVVPYTRGTEYSRPAVDIMEEARDLIDNGVKEITLLGQNVNAYHGIGNASRPVGLAGLLHELATLSGLERLRYTTSHPKDMDAALIAAHAEIDKLMPYLHLPFQAGSDRILAAMNRKHTAREYIDLVDSIRAARPDIALSTDIIVGFPGESDEEFQATLDLVREVTFAHAYSFKFSPRPGTPAAAMEEQVPETLKAERLQLLQGELNRQQAAFNQASTGRILPVLFEKQGMREGQILGRSPYLQAVHVEGNNDLIGAIHQVRIKDAGPNSLSGVIEHPQHTVLREAVTASYGK